MAATKLFKNGSSAAARERSIGVQLTTVRVKLGGERVNFLWLGAPPVDPVRPSPAGPRHPAASRIIARPQQWSYGTWSPRPLPSSPTLADVATQAEASVMAQLDGHNGPCPCERVRGAPLIPLHEMLVQAQRANRSRARPPSARCASLRIRAPASAACRPRATPRDRKPLRRSTRSRRPRATASRRRSRSRRSSSPPTPHPHTPPGRLSGAELLRRLPLLRGWWLARDADEALRKAHPRACLAWYFDVSLEEMDGALGEAKLFSKGVSAGSRLQRLGPHTTARVQVIGDAQHNFFWVGSTEAQWSVTAQLEGAAGTQPPARVRGTPEMGADEILRLAKCARRDDAASSG